MNHLSTLYFAVEVPDSDDFTHLIDAAYQPDSVLIRQLEMVIRTHFGGVIVNPVRNAVILKVADAQVAEQALQLLGEIVTMMPAALHNAPPMDDVIATHHAIRSSLEVIEHGGG